jgi:hypothetical protein
MTRHFAGAAVLVALVGMAGCKPAAEPAAPVAATPATVAAPALVAAPVSVAAPAVANVPASPAERMQWLAKGAKSIQCSTGWMAKAKFSPADSGLHFLDAGIGPEMHDVAQKIAAANVAKLEGMRMPANEAERAQLDFAAISMAKDVPVTDPNQLPAIAWMAYFLDRVAQGNCPPPPELLGLIGKQK